MGLGFRVWGLGGFRLGAFIRALDVSPNDREPRQGLLEEDVKNLRSKSRQYYIVLLDP